MTFTSQSKMLQRVLGFRALEHREGKLFLWNTLATLWSLPVLSYFWKLLEHQCGEKTSCEILYNTGRFQALQGMGRINKRFGYAKKIHSKKKLVEFNLEHSELLGLGRFNLIISDFKKERFVIAGRSSFAEERKRLFGIQKKACDHYLRGCGTGIFEYTLGKKMFCLEKRCVVMNHKRCEFVIKPEERWDKKDPLVREQWVSWLADPGELGFKKVNTTAPHK